MEGPRLGLLLLAAAVSRPGLTAKQPNIILILADDLGQYQEVLYTQGMSYNLLV